MPAPALPTLSVSPGLPRRADLLVVGLAEAGLRGVPDSVEQAYVKRFGVGVAEMATSLGARTAAGSRRTLPPTGDGPQLMVIGLGAGEPGSEDLRQAAGSAVRQAGASAAEGRAIAVVISFGTTSLSELEAVAEGALIGSYRYAPVSGKEPRPLPVESVAVVHAGSTRVAGSADVTAVAPVVARAVVTTREWVNVPPNLLYPESFADEARALVKDAKITIEVLDGPALTKGGYGGILAVGGGSSRPPRLVRLSYRPRGAKQHLALVGKGITFDSGGLNLKPGESMYTMKCDMAGAAAVLAATHAIARLGLAVNVTTYAALAENLPSDTAYRPSDVLTMYGGTTVENGNTDAEGRIVMADALVRAGEDAPDLVVDVATLTGACIVALGDRTAGLMATDDETADRVLDAAEAAGEDFWQLPIPRETRGKLDSKVADLKSTGSDKTGGALVAAAFLREFVPAGIPWAHLDIAGPAYFDGKPYGYVGPGGTGVGVRTLIALARSMTS
ncbi:leucyl aminopeptidase [uncultured Friedmanniella sp.]|uniref:leucyl aminopeptidase n=1 Tax=uncultured Friedmanniella sp. TaxID=335381 RepID=UPI0035CC6D95